MTPQEWNGILQRLRENDPSLTNLDLTEQEIGAEGAKDLAEALKVNKTLTNLDLYNNQIGAEVAKAFAGTLEVNKTLTNLNLGSNQIGAEGAKAFAEALKNNKTLTSLYLSLNQIGAEGAKDLAEALKVNEALTDLNLSLNQIGAEGAKAFAGTLEVNKTLTNLNLGLNQIKDEEIGELIDALKINPFVTELWLSIYDQNQGQLCQNLLNQNQTMVPAIVEKIIAAGLKTQNGQETQGNAVQLTEEENRFIGDPNNAAKVIKIMEKAYAQKEGVDSKVSTVELFKNQKGTLPYTLDRLQIQALFHFLDPQNNPELPDNLKLPETLNDFAKDLNLKDYFKTSGVAKFKTSDLRHLPSEIVLNILGYLGQKGVKRPTPLMPSLSTPTAAAIEEDPTKELVEATKTMSLGSPSAMVSPNSSRPASPTTTQNRTNNGSQNQPR